MRRAAQQVCRQGAQLLQKRAVAVRAGSESLADLKQLGCGELIAMDKEAPKRPHSTEVLHLPPERSPSKGGKAGGRVAATHAPSAAAIAKLLGGIDFPKSRTGIVAYAQEHQDRVQKPKEALAVLRHIPARKYVSMADVAAGLGAVR